MGTAKDLKLISPQQYAAALAKEGETLNPKP